MNAQISKKDLMAKARGFTTSIEKMDEKQAARVPSGQYGEDYNKLRTLTAELFPHLNDLLPPPVQTYVGAGGSIRYTRQAYSEIDTFCEQIFQLLSEQE